MSGNGVLRLFLVFLSCFAIIFCNAAEIIKKDTFFNYFESKGTADYFLSDGGELELVPEAPQKTESEPQKTESSSKAESTADTSSKQTSAEAVKGKILSQYISPYNAPLSYNGVYMKNSTDLKIDIKALLGAKLGFKIEKNSQPQVLILHTHATETFMQTDNDYYTADFSSRTKDTSKNMVKIGSIVAEKLNSAGIKTLHDKTLHDSPQYSGSYSRAAETICSYLKKYPSIKIVLDLHRDAVTSGNDKVKLVTEIEGKKAAQVMLVMGSQSGSVTNFPKWQENLKLALRLQQILEIKFPTLARPLSLMPKNYNQSLTTGSLLLEFGTDANTLTEACFSAELVGEALVSLLNTL
ncbi:MAG: stage II sporulation protein P [Clostridia bacterium]|nr:stage II sporulation protein P [Clostridia bacterium]